MANLTPTPGWDDVPQLETTTPVLGGPGGVANAQAQALLNRFAALAGTGSGHGASQVGSEDAGGYYWGNDVEEILQELASPIGSFADGLHLLRYIDPSEWTAISNSTSAFDASTAFVTALNALKVRGGGKLILPYGTVAVSTVAFQYDTSSAPSVSIRGQGQKASFVKKLGVTTTAVLALTVNALGNGVFASLEDFTVQGISTCNGVDMTLFARFQTVRLGITGCDVAMNSAGCLIASHYDPHWSNNKTGFKCVHSGTVYPNLVSFYGGAVFQNSSWGFDFGDGDSIFVYGTDIELNGTAGNTGTGGAVCRSTLGAASSNSSIAFHGGWFEANFGNGLLIEANASLAVSLNDCKFVNNESHNSLTCGAIRSLIIENCHANAFLEAYTIGAVTSLTIRGGSVWTLTNSAVNWELQGVLLGGATVKHRVGGAAAGLETLNFNGGRHQSGTSSVSAATATATTLFTVSGAGPRMITVFACLGGSGASYTSNARYAWDGSNLVRMGGENAANLTLTASGANVQVTQISGVTQSVFYVSDVIGA